MTPEQFARLLEMLDKHLQRSEHYTLTGAADWPILAVIGGLLIGVIGCMWRDIRTTVKEIRTEWKADLDKHEIEAGKQFDHAWAALRDCQGDCCPPRFERQQSRRKQDAPPSTTEP